MSAGKDANGNHTWQQFDSWTSGLAAWCDLINSDVYVGSGLNNVGEILPKYAPSYENNTDEYINEVRSWVGWMRGDVPWGQEL